MAGACGVGVSTVSAATDPLHEALETRTGLPGSMRDPDDVAGFLTRWVALAGALEPHAGEHLDGSLLPALHADLAALGADRPVDAPARVDRATGDRALGVAWVLLGARLGLRSLSATVTDVVGHPLATFDAVDARPLLAVRRAIDDLDEQRLADVVDGAVAAFETAADVLGGPPWST